MPYKKVKHDSDSDVYSVDDFDCSTVTCKKSKPSQKSTYYELSLRKIPNSRPIGRIVPFDNLIEYTKWLEKPAKSRPTFRDRYIYLVEHNRPIPKDKAELEINEKDIGEGIVVPMMVRQEKEHCNHVFIAGGTLSGKSTLASTLAHDYNTKFKDNRVILISGVHDKKNYNDKRIKHLFPIRLDETLLEDPLKMEELHDSCAIFDDIGASDNKDVIYDLEALRDQCIKTGRHHNIDTITTSQSLLDGNATKHALRNCFQVVAFPSSAGKYQLANFLHQYIKMGKDDSERVLNVPSRYVLINRTAPTYVLHSNGAFIL